MAERQRLRELLDIVQHADRVVALPVEATVGTGLSIGTPTSWRSP